MPSVIVQLVEPAGMLTADEVPVVEFAGTVTVPPYVAVGVEQLTVNGNVIALVVAGPPVTFLVTVNEPGFAVNGLLIVPVSVPPGGSAPAAGCV